MELLWYDIRTLDTDTMAHTVGMMDEERRRRVNDIARRGRPQAHRGR